LRLLVPTGGSPHSAKAIEFAALLAADLGGSVTALTVVKSVALRPSAHAILAAAQAVLSAHLPESATATALRIGHPAEEILAEAEAGGYSAIVIGEKQHHGLVTRFLLGSTAQRVVEHSPLPVVVAKGKIGPIRRILLCDSAVGDAPLVELVAADLPELVDAAESVTVLHVMSHMAAAPGVNAHEVLAEAELLIEEHTSEGDALERDKAVLARRGVEPVLKVRHGLVVEEVAVEAESHDLVVIGAHRGSGWRRMILGDIAHQILIGVPRPVLIVPVRH
jgi:nucleotide-binding universal stress UspA family protein